MKFLFIFHWLFPLADEVENFDSNPDLVDLMGSLITIPFVRGAGGETGNGMILEGAEMVETLDLKPTCLSAAFTTVA